MIAVLQTISVILLTAKRFYYGLLLFVFMLPFMPRYLGMPWGASSVTARRMILAYFVLVFIAWFSSKPERVSTVSRSLLRGKAVVLIFVFLFIFKLMATLLGDDASNLLYVFDDFLSSIFVLILASTFFSEQKARQGVVLVVLYGLLLCEALAIIEYLKQSPLLQGIYTVDVETRTSVATIGVVRDDVYRTQVLYDNPLLFSEFVCLAWPLAWYSYRHGDKRLNRSLGLFALLLAPLSLYFVASRGGWLVFAITIGFMLYLSYWFRLDRSFKGLAFTFLIMLIAMGSFATYEVFSNPADYFSSDEKSGRSALERINQYSVVSQAFEERPILGYGAQQNFANDLEFLNNLDNYWLRLVLEVGAVGIVLFVIGVIYTFRSARKVRTGLRNARDFALLVALITSLFSILLYKFFLSIPWNNIYLYLLIGMIVSWKVTTPRHGDDG